MKHFGLKSRVAWPLVLSESARASIIYTRRQNCQINGDGGKRSPWMRPKRPPLACERKVGTSREPSFPTGLVRICFTEACGANYCVDPEAGRAMCGCTPCGCPPHHRY